MVWHAFGMNDEAEAGAKENAVIGERDILSHSSYLAEFPPKYGNPKMKIWITCNVRIALRNHATSYSALHREGEAKVVSLGGLFDCADPFARARLTD